MPNDQAQPTGTQPPQPLQPPQPEQQQDAAAAPHGGQPSDDFDGLEGKKPDELTAEELRLMADTMPGEGPGD